MKDWHSEIEFILKGKKQSFTPIIESYENELFQIATSLGITSEKAEEVTIETFIYVYNEICKGKQTEPLHEWFTHTSIQFILEKVSSNSNEVLATGETGFSAHFQELTIQQKKQLYLDVLFNITGDEVNELKWNIIQSSLQEKQNDECLSTDTLFTYYSKNGPQEFVVDVEDHLEFCPACRQRLDSLTQQLKKLAQYIKGETLDHSLSGKILPNLKVIKRKKKVSFMKQLVVAIATITLFASILFFMPNVERWSTLASNYIKYGEFYNVWADGTYVATDKDISIEFTSIELTDTLTKIDFRISSENEFKETYYHLGEHLISSNAYGMFSIKIGDDTYPLENVAVVTTSDDLLEGSFYINIGEMEQKLLQDEMTLVFRSVRIGGIFGDWTMEIPLEFTNGLKKTYTVVEGKRYTLFDKFEVFIEKSKQNSLGSELAFSVNLTEEEQLRFDKMNELHANKYNMDMMGIHYRYNIITEDGKTLLEFPYAYDGYHFHFPEQQGDMNVKRFMPFLLSEYSETEPTSMERAIRAEDKLFIKIEDISYQHIVEEELTISLEEVENKPLNLEIDGSVFENLTVRKMEATEVVPERFIIYILGYHHDEHVEKNFSWYRDDNDDYLREVHSDYYYDDYWKILTDLEENTDKNVLFFNILPVVATANQTVTYKLDFIHHNYKPGPEHLIPIN